MPTNMSIDSDAHNLSCDETNQAAKASANEGASLQHNSKHHEGETPVEMTERLQRTGFSTQSVHAGEKRQKAEGSISAPIFTASTFTFDSTDSLMRFVDGKEDRDEYGRYGTPNERTCEAKLAALEGAEEAIIYSSGMAAIVGLLMSRLNSGDEIVFFDQCYHRSREFCSKHLSRFGETEP